MNSLITKSIKKEITGLIFLSLVLAFLSGCQVVSNDKDKEKAWIDHNFNTAWATDTLWDDGNAEVAKYDAKRIVYGRERQFEYVFITVKEDFNEECNTKTDSYDREDLFPVMKINMFANIQTDNYPYHYLTTIFLKREDPLRVFKMTNTSQEWCGNTFKEFLSKARYYAYDYHSYFDKEGDGKKEIREYPVLFEDQLGYTLRSLKFKEGKNFSASVLNTQISNRAKEPIVYSAEFNVEKDSTQQDSISAECWRIDVKLDSEKLNKYWIGISYPNFLLRQECWDGRKLVLRSVKRYPYWERK